MAKDCNDRITIIAFDSTMVATTGAVVEGPLRMFIPSYLSPNLRRPQSRSCMRAEVWLYRRPNPGRPSEFAVMQRKP